MNTELGVDTCLFETQFQESSAEPMSSQESLRRGTWQLLQAYEYAMDLKRDRWDFAVEVFALRSAGVTMADMRWLIYKGLANHGREFTVAGDSERRIQKGGQFLPTNRCCMVLTDAGVDFARELHSSDALYRNHRPNAVTTANNIASCSKTYSGGSRLSTLSGNSSLPSWDASRRELWFNGQLVKQFKLPSANQETIIMAFDEEHWATRVDDPLPPTPNIDPKRRLNDAIKSLNRRQKNHCMRFMGDGRGLGVIWEAVRVAARG